MSLRLLALAAFAALVSAPLRADDAEKKLLATTAAQFNALRTETLPNGLKVYLLPVKGSPVVSTMLAYKVGSADEDKTSTGLAHYLEHLLFKGTTKLKPGDIDRFTFRAGGNNNAYTKTDLTAYHFNLPAGRWKTALAIEADRMRNTKVDRAHEFDKEKGAVINELMGGEDSPWDLEYKSMLPLLYGKQHPYGHPVIGESAHVRAATEKIITDFYHRWYYPNNAALVIVGGFDADEAMGVIKKLFSDIPRGKLPERKPVPEEKPKLPARQVLKSKFSVPPVIRPPPCRLAWLAPIVEFVEVSEARGLAHRNRPPPEPLDLLPMTPVRLIVTSPKAETPPPTFEARLPAITESVRVADERVPELPETKTPAPCQA